MAARKPRPIIPPNEAAVRELELYIDNDSRIYNRRLEFELNAARKICRGKYDATKAPALWAYLADEAAQSYTREHGTPGARLFTTSDRREVARSLARDFEQRVEGFRSGMYPGDLREEVQAVLSSKSCKR